VAGGSSPPGRAILKGVNFMCLSNIDETIKKHRIGYKIFKRDAETKKLRSPFIRQDKVYPLKKWITDNNTDYCIKILTSSHSYKTGFHYYLRKKDAIEVCNVLLPNSGTVYRILVRKNVCTGGQQLKRLYPCGVSTEMFIEKRMTENKNTSRLDAKGYKKLVQALKVKKIATYLDKIIKAKRQGQDVSKLYEKYFDIISKDINTYCEWICFTDSFERDSTRFNAETMFHQFCMKNFRKAVEMYSIVTSHDGIGFIHQPHLDAFKQDKLNY
jgi:hypothetical protein